MTDTVMIREVIRIDTDQIVGRGDGIGKTEPDPGMHKIIGRGNFRSDMGMHQNFERQNSREK